MARLEQVLFDGLERGFGGVLEVIESLPPIRAMGLSQS